MIEDITQHIIYEILKHSLGVSEAKLHNQI